MTRPRRSAGDELNFLLTNRIPRRALTTVMGWFSTIENPIVARASLALWRTFSDLDLSDAQQTRFRSVQACFTRALKDGARPVDRDPSVVVSPCDAIVGAHGSIADAALFQVKGFPYTLQDLLGDAADVARYRDGKFVTLRLTATMYHRFHAPTPATMTRVRSISGDTWNVNPPALTRIAKLYCKNERAVLSLRDDRGDDFALVPIAAILVASIRLHGVGLLRGMTSREVTMPVAKGDELGWFEHGSTIVMLVPARWSFAPDIAEGRTIRMGQGLFRR